MDSDRTELDTESCGPSTSHNPGSSHQLDTTPMAMVTRKAAEFFGLGKGINVTDSDITGSRLPTSRQVLRCLMFHIQEDGPNNGTKWAAAKTVLSKVAVFYGKGNIPLISERKACEKIIKLLTDNNKITALPSDNTFHHRQTRAS